jgi:hypothetical protein
MRSGRRDLLRSATGLGLYSLALAALSDVLVDGVAECSAGLWDTTTRIIQRATPVQSSFQRKAGNSPFTSATVLGSAAAVRFQFAPLCSGPEMTGVGAQRESTALGVGNPRSRDALARSWRLQAAPGVYSTE